MLCFRTPANPLYTNRQQAAAVPKRSALPSQPNLTSKIILPKKSFSYDDSHRNRNNNNSRTPNNYIVPAFQAKKVGVSRHNKTTNLLNNQNSVGRNLGKRNKDIRLVPDFYGAGTAGLPTGRSGAISRNSNVSLEARPPTRMPVDQRLSNNFMPTIQENKTLPKQNTNRVLISANHKRKQTKTKKLQKPVFSSSSSSIIPKPSQLIKKIPKNSYGHQTKPLSYNNGPYGREKLRSRQSQSPQKLRSFSTSHNNRVKSPQKVIAGPIFSRIHDHTKSPNLRYIDLQPHIQKPVGIPSTPTPSQPERSRQPTPAESKIKDENVRRLNERLKLSQMDEEKLKRLEKALKKKISEKLASRGTTPASTPRLSAREGNRTPRTPRTPREIFINQTSSGPQEQQQPNILKISYPEDDNQNPQANTQALNQAGETQSKYQKKIKNRQVSLDVKERGSNSNPKVIIAEKNNFLKNTKKSQKQQEKEISIQTKANKNKSLKTEMDQAISDQDHDDNNNNTQAQNQNQNNKNFTNYVKKIKKRLTNAALKGSSKDLSALGKSGVADGNFGEIGENNDVSNSSSSIGLGENRNASNKIQNLNLNLSPKQNQNNATHSTPNFIKRSITSISAKGDAVRSKYSNVNKLRGRDNRDTRDRGGDRDRNIANNFASKNHQSRSKNSSNNTKLYETKPLTSQQIKDKIKKESEVSTNNDNNNNVNVTLNSGKQTQQLNLLMNKTMKWVMTQEFKQWVVEDRREYKNDPLTIQMGH